MGLTVAIQPIAHCGIVGQKVDVEISFSFPFYNSHAPESEAELRKSSCFELSDTMQSPPLCRLTLGLA